MPQFGSPITLGYGLGQAGAEATQGILRGQIAAPQLAYEKLRNQALQTQLTNQQAQQQALSQEAPPLSEGQQDLTPYDKPLRDMETQIKSLRQAGQGQKVQEMMPQFVQLSQQQHVAQLGRGAQMLLGPNPKMALPYIKGAGLGEVADVSVDPQSGNFTFVSPDGTKTQMSRQDVANIAADPSHLAQYMAMQNLYGARIQNYENLAENRRAENERKIKHDIFTHEDALKRIQQSGVNAQIGASGRVGAAQVTQQGANRRFDLTPANAAYSYLTSPTDDPDSPGLGLSADEALTTLTAAKTAAKTKDPAQVAHELAMKMLPNHPGWTPEDAVNAQSAILRGLGAKPKTPPKAAPTGGIPTVKSQADYDKIPKGGQYKDASGTTRTKG